MHFEHNFTWNRPVEYPFTPGKGIGAERELSFRHWGHFASLRRVGLSSRHLLCDSRSTYRVTVGCVQNFESFSIDWCRCEVLSTQHLFSVSFLS
jgi:hypothetical protein